MINILRINMRHNKFILHFFILFVFLISITAISAADLNDTGSIDILNDNGGNSFNDLNSVIQIENSSFTFERDYGFNSEIDKSYSSGINVTKDNFVINGNNHKVDCKNQSRAFDISGKNVVINNLTIVNGFYGYGSAIRTDSRLTLNNVTFINCFGDGEKSNYGAVYSYNTALNVNDCKFIDNGGENGASISSFMSTVNIVNSTFYSNSDKIVKGQVYFGGSSHANIVNSNFLNTTSKYAAAIFFINDGNLTIKNSKFKKLFANRTAGAIGAKVISSLIISNCEFDDVSSENNGGAIFADIFGGGSVFGSETLITDTLFNNCQSRFGGAILQLDGNLVIKNTNFTSNRAEYGGGAIYTSYTDVKIYNSNFTSNEVLSDGSTGGACYFDESSATLNGNYLENNNGSVGSAIFAYDNELTLNENYFNNPSGTSIYTVYGKVKFDNKNNFNSDVKSLNNKNNNYNFENNAEQLIIINNTLYFKELPKKFDLRSYNWTTPVKDQGFMGACWAFGNMAALESALLRYTNKTYSLSVNNMQNLMLKFSKYGSDTIEEGGNPFTAIAYLIDWLGVFDGEYEEYDEMGKISQFFGTTDNIHIQNVVAIPPLRTDADRNLLKNALINYGAVAVSHHADFNESKYFNKTSSAQYCYDQTDSTHRVCIVGWDDNYSRYNFLKTPKGDGAWIVKNSWGTGWGDKGYFYISYYDTSLADKESVCYIINNDSYNRIYQHDVGGDWKWLPESKYYCSVFTADEDELIGAVGTCFKESGMEYEFTISVNGIDLYTQKGISKFYGYETIKLDKLVQIKKGDKFKVTFKNMVCVANDLRIHPQYGQSFVSDSSKEWEDLAKVMFVAILKAYTVSDLNMTNNLVKYYLGDDQFVANVTPGEEVTFEVNGVSYSVKANDTGFAMLEINLRPGNYSITTTCGNVSIVNYIIVKSTIVSSDVIRGYNSDYNYKLQVLDSTGKGLNNTKVTVSINGNSKVFVTDKSGYITIPFKKLTKSQKIIVTNPVNSEVKKTTIKVVSRFSGAKNLVMYYFDGSKFKVKVIGDDGKAVGKNQVVTIKLNKKTYKVKTNAKGYAILKMPKTLKPGKYTLKATYKGQTIKKTVKVKQNLKSKKKYKVKKSAKKLVIKATLKNGKKAVKNKKITLKIKGKKLKAKTNKKGVAKFTIKKNIIKKLKRGKTYTVKVTYLKNTIKTKVKVK